MCNTDLDAPNYVAAFPWRCVVLRKIAVLAVVFPSELVANHDHYRTQVSSENRRCCKYGAYHLIFNKHKAPARHKIQAFDRILYRSRRCACGDNGTNGNPAATSIRQMAASPKFCTVNHLELLQHAGRREGAHLRALQDQQCGTKFGEMLYCLMPNA